MKIKFGAAVLLGLALATPAAAVQVLECSFQPVGANLGWMSKQYVIKYDQAAGTALVADDVVMQEVGKPVEAKVKIVSANQTVFTWTVQSKDTANNFVNMLYRATLFAADQTMLVTGKPKSYSNNFEVRGKCKVSQG